MLKTILIDFKDLNMFKNWTNIWCEENNHFFGGMRNLDFDYHIYYTDEQKRVYYRVTILYTKSHFWLKLHIENLLELVYFM